MYIHCSIVLVLSVSLSDSLTWYNSCYRIQNKRMLWDLSHVMKVWEHWKAFCRQKYSSKLDYRYFLSPSQILLINVTVSSSGKDFIAETFSLQNVYFSDWKLSCLKLPFADSAQTEYCSTFPLSVRVSVCPSQAWHLTFLTYIKA